MRFVRACEAADESVCSPCAHDLCAPLVAPFCDAQKPRGFVITPGASLVLGVDALIGFAQVDNAVICPASVYVVNLIGRAYVVRADWLVPLPMKYFGGQVP